MEDYGWAWHVHHNVLVEPLTSSMEDRIMYIMREKPECEVPARLRLLKRVQGNLPKVLLEADRRCATIERDFDNVWWAYAGIEHPSAKENQALDDAQRVCNDAGWAYNKVWEDCLSEILALHAKECPDCPWDGETISPKGRGA